MAQPAQSSPPNMPGRRYRSGSDQPSPVVVSIEAVRQRRRKATNRREIGMTTGRVLRILDGTEEPPESVDPETISAIRRLIRLLRRS